MQVDSENDKEVKEGKHILLCSLGVKSIETIYKLNGKQSKSGLSTIALIDLLSSEEKPDEIYALCTEKAIKETYPILEKNTDVPLYAIEIPRGSSKDELYQVMRRILNKANEVKPSALTMDLTHSFRNIPFIFYSSALYLSALEDVEIRGIWYGMLEAKDEDGMAPLVDLSVILELTEWFHGVRSFKEEYNAKLLRALMVKRSDIDRDDTKDVKKEKENLEHIAEKSARFTRRYYAGLPLEMEKISTELLDHISQIKDPDEALGIPLMRELITKVQSSVEDFALASNPSTNFKSKVTLDSDEMQRQMNIIESYLDSGHVSNAAGVIREFILSWLMLKMGESGVKCDWLSYHDKEDCLGRETIGRKLNIMKNILQDDSEFFEGEQRELIKCWDVLSKIRNDFAHNGFKVEEVKIDDYHDKIIERWKIVRRNLDNDDFLDLEFGGGGGTYLITSLGKSKGLLYTALKEMTKRPERCIVIASKETVGFVDEVVEKAGYDPDRVHFSVMNDPYTGFEEVDGIVKKHSKDLISADEVYCNITGGTTFMQWVIKKLADEAEGKGRRVEWVAMVDEREFQEQQENPYVLGKMIRLDGNEEGG